MIKRLIILRLIIIVVLLIVAGIGIVYFMHSSEIRMEKTHISDTATQIKEVREIGEWEFLTVDCEVLVDSTRKRMWPLPDDRLARIYHGALRLGVDLKDAPDTWVRTGGDSVATLTLPAIKLLDDRFIDEAATTAFYERGDWDGKAMESMYRQADRKMRAYALTPEHYENARRVAEAQFTSLFRTFGFKKVSVNFGAQ